MNNVILSENVRPFDGAKDIDNAPRVELTEENNGYAVWRYDDNNGTILSRFFNGKYMSSKLSATRYMIVLIDKLKNEGV